MVLVDTSVWVFHFRQTHGGLVDLLNNGEAACHPFIVGELACGSLKNRTNVISLLEALPMTSLVDHEEVSAFIEGHDLMGKGLGYVDVHLLASAVLTGVSFWTLDKKLARLLRDSIAGINRRPDNESLHRTSRKLRLFPHDFWVRLAVRSQNCGLVHTRRS